MEFYNRYLKIIEGQLGHNCETDSFELNSLCSRLFGNRFAGVYASDEPPSLSNIRDLCIMNLDKRGQRGSHWVGVVYKNGDVYVYDSFGRSTKKILPSLLKMFKFVYDTEYDKEQKMVEENCGQRCISALLTYTNHGLQQFLEL